MLYTLRKSTSEDADFAHNTVKVTMKDYAVKTWGAWLENESRASVSKDASLGNIQIIEINGASIGTFQVVESEESIFIEQLYILPEYQNKGLGTRILMDLMAEARARSLPIKLNVLQVNPAKRLYIRHGFVVDDEDNERVYMKYVP